MLSLLRHEDDVYQTDHRIWVVEIGLVHQGIGIGVDGILVLTGEAVVEEMAAVVVTNN